MKRTRRARRLLPSVDIHDVKHGYFMHDNEVYAVSMAPDAVFRAAVLALAPYWWTHEVHGPLLRTDIDLAARWWLLCALMDSDRPMRLYRSRGQAEVVCGSVGALC
jgi:hypothetical protein